MTTPIIDTAAVLGGGIFGVSAALHLARLGVRTTLVNDGPLGGGASGRSLAWLNSAGLRPAPYHTLRVAGIERYRALAEREPDASWLRLDGGLYWRADGPSNPIAARHAHETAIGYPSERLTGEATARRLKGVRAGAVPEEGAILNVGEGWVELPVLIERMAGELAALGGEIVTDAGAAEPILSDDRAVGLRCADGREIAGDAVLLAAGAAVPALAASLGCPIADATPVALLVESEPVDHPLRAVLNTPRVAVRRTSDGAFLFDSGWSEREGCAARGRARRGAAGDDRRPRRRPARRARSGSRHPRRRDPHGAETHPWGRPAGFRTSARH